MASIDDQGRIVILRNATGDEVTPSAVFFEPGGVVVGEEALQATTVDPANGVRLIKRHMGTEFPIMVGGPRCAAPESISALILRQIVAAAPGRELAAKPRAVITVPAYFGLAEREATACRRHRRAGGARAARRAGRGGGPLRASRAGDRTVLVYDLGGGTFDTTVLRISGGAVEVVATDGHHSLGGADVDQRLFDVMLERLEDLISRDSFDEFADDRALLGSLVLDVEAAKRDLSSRTSRDVIVRTATGRISVTLSRADLEAACADLFDTTAEIIERVLALARSAGAAAIDEVIMVGGSSRIPLLSAQLTSMLGITPRLIEPGLAVAKGAALRAHQLLATTQLTALTKVAGAGLAAIAGTIRTVAPRAVGILVEDSYDPAGERSLWRLVRANTPLPVTKTEERFGTILAGQESVRIQVYGQAGASPSPEVAHNRRVLES